MATLRVEHNKQNMTVWEIKDTIAIRQVRDEYNNGKNEEAVYLAPSQAKALRDWLILRFP